MPAKPVRTGATDGRAAVGDTTAASSTVSTESTKGRRETLERQWRDLAGAGRTALPAGAAARVRETVPLSVAELAQAQRDVVIQRRHWKP